MVLEHKVSGLLTAKAVLKEGGVIGSEHARHPWPPLSPAARASVIALARKLDLLALRWAR
jgi:hypothetical protein